MQSPTEFVERGLLIASLAAVPSRRDDLAAGQMHETDAGLSPILMLATLASRGERIHPAFGQQVRVVRRWCGRKFRLLVGAIVGRHCALGVKGLAGSFTEI